MGWYITSKLRDRPEGRERRRGCEVNLLPGTKAYLRQGLQHSPLHGSGPLPGDGQAAQGQPESEESGSILTGPADLQR